MYFAMSNEKSFTLKVLTYFEYISLLIFVIYLFIYLFQSSLFQNISCVSNRTSMSVFLQHGFQFYKTEYLKDKIWNTIQLKISFD